MERSTQQPGAFTGGGSRIFLGGASIIGGARDTNFNLFKVDQNVIELRAQFVVGAGGGVPILRSTNDNR